MPSLRRALPGLFALLLALVVLAPVATAPGTDVAGVATVDAYGTWWFQWWVAHALSAGKSPLFTDLIFYPWGKDILTHTGGNVLDAASIVPFRLLLGPAAAANLLVLAIVATNAAAAGAWARRLGGDLPTVLVAELVVGLHPFVLDELARGRPTQAILAPVIVALAAGDAAFQTGNRRAAALAAAALALAGWIYWYAAGFAALALVLLAVGRPLGRRSGNLALVGFGSLVLTLPMVIPLATALASGEVPGLLPVHEWLAGNAEFVNAQGGAVQLSTLDTLGGAGFETSEGRVPEGLALGAITVALALAGPWRWRAVSLLGLAVAFGPFPGGHPNPVYLGLVAGLPPFARLYWPIRAVALLVPAAALGAVGALGRLPARARPWVAAGMAVALCAEVGLRGGLPIGAWRPTVPDALDCLRAEGGAGIILPYGYDQVPLVWQAGLGLPMLNGMAERSLSLVPKAQQELRANNGWIRSILLAPTDPRAELSWTEEEKAAIGAMGYRWVVLRPEALYEPGTRANPKGRARAAMRVLAKPLGAPVRVTDEVVIYAPWGGLDACRAGTSR